MRFDVDIFRAQQSVLIRGALPSDEVDTFVDEVRGGDWVRDDLTSGNFLFDRLVHDSLNERLNERMMALAGDVSRALEGASVARFEGYIKRMKSGTEYRFPWHSDRSGGRLMGLSLCLESAGGGAFEMRKKWSKEVLVRFEDLRPGDVHLFNVIDPDWVHRVSPVLSVGSRVFFAGWFYSH